MLYYREEDDNNRDPYTMVVVKGVGSILHTSSVTGAIVSHIPQGITSFYKA